MDLSTDATLEVHLDRPIEIGPEASRFEGRLDEAEVELRNLHRLTGSQRARLVRLRGTRHEGLLPIVGAQLDGAGPHWIAVPRTDRSFATHPPAGTDRLRATLVALADALAAAHQAAVVHGALEPHHVRLGPHGVWLDMTGTDAAGGRERAPEIARGEPPTSLADVWALGRMLAPLVAERSDPQLEALLAEMSAAEPEERPAAREIALRLDRTQAVAATPAARPTGTTIPGRLGPYRLLTKLGEGGMGAVYRARGDGEDRDVAIKVLLPEWAGDATVLSRFRREARVLSQLATPYIARFIAAHRDGPWEYMVMEFVEGKSAHRIVQEVGPFSVPAALAIACDVARALSEVHALGLVHRDVKPSNILIAGGSDLAKAPRAKLCDFGIVRRGGGDDRTALTQAGVPGTPSYMAPEQVLKEEVTAATDVYALGATLFALLAKRPPFVGDSSLVMLAHLSEPPPALEAMVPEVPPDVAAIVKRALEKDPAARYPDARAMLEALEVVRSGSSAAPDALPQPIALAGTPLVYVTTCDLKSPPAELWPHVSNTERLNRAVGLADVAWSRAGEGDAPRLEGSFRAAGIELRWKENPFEWVAPHRLGVVREYQSGPFEWMRSTVDLKPEGSGTRLTHTVEIRPRGLLGRAAAGVEIGLRLRRALDRTYRRIDEICQREKGGGGGPLDPFEAAPPVDAAGRALLHERMERARARGADPHVLEMLEDWILAAPPQELGRVRPFVLADRLHLDRHATLGACLLASSEGVLTMLWDILCPTCRIPSQLKTTLEALERHGRCDACDLDFELDLARSVELVFRVEETIRKPDTGLYCIGGPAHSPHVVAQVRMPAGHRFMLDCELDEGAYQIRGRGLSRAHPFRVVRGGAQDAWTVSLRDGLDPESLRVAKEGRLHVELVNDLEREVVVRLERSSDRRNLVTAADATSNALFRKLFPGELLAPEQLIGISHVALLSAEVVDVAERYESGDERLAHREIINLSTQVMEAAEAEGGALVKLQLEGVLAVFADPAAATRAALRLVRSMGTNARASVHAGTAMLTTINERLDYFGKTVFLAAGLLADAAPGELVVTEEAHRADPRVGAALRGEGELVGVVQRRALAMRYRPRPH